MFLPYKHEVPLQRERSVTQLTADEDKTNQAIVYFWGRIYEKFDKITKAFRYFDVHSVRILI